MLEKSIDKIICNAVITFVDIFMPSNSFFFPTFLDIQAQQLFGSQHEDNCILYNFCMSETHFCIVSYAASSLLQCNLLPDEVSSRSLIPSYCKAMMHICNYVLQNKYLCLLQSQAYEGRISDHSLFL